MAKLLYGQAFRAPSFNETAGLNNPTNRGNPNARPETIRTIEIALEWQVNKDTQWKVNLFSFRLKDILRAVPNAIAGTGATTQNAGGQNGQGLETEFTWQASSLLRLLGNYSYQRNIDQATPTPTQAMHRITTFLPGPTGVWGWIGYSAHNGTGWPGANGRWGITAHPICVCLAC